MDGCPDSHARRAALLRLAGLTGLSATVGGLGFWLRDGGGRTEKLPAMARRPGVAVPRDSRFPELTIVRGDDPRALVRAAFQQLGGVERFIVRGEVVVVKPNMSWDRTPEQAANTNPEVVAEVVRLCRAAGAGEVVVTDVSINEPRRCFERSGIAAAARAAGADVILPEERLFRDVDLRGTVLKSWPVLDPFLEAGKVINIAIAKHHSLTGASLGMKNLYGILGGSRQRLHQLIDESLVDLTWFMRPALTIIDASRVLLRNGPGGGNVADVIAANTLIAGTDPVAVDAYAAKTWWDLDASRLRYLRLAAARGLGAWDLTDVRTSRLTL
jgi:uncharacterized protein (DUF362 family)